MKKHIIIALISVLVVSPSKHWAMDFKNEKLFPGVKKISDDFYVGQVEDGFYLGMERIDEKNIDAWLKYAKEETQHGNSMSLWVPNFSDSGSSAFAMVLNDYKQKEIEHTNEVWCAYTSSKLVTEKTLTDLIEMFVSITMLPETLITSHMGISRTAQKAFFDYKGITKKHPDESINLHSFAAKVATIRYPHEMYMLTSPVDSMREILVKKMPIDSVFIGGQLLSAER